VSAILSAVIFNALIIVALIPLALRGVPLPVSSARRVLLRRNLLVYGLGGIAAVSGGSNLGPLNPALAAAVEARIAALRAADPGNTRRSRSTS
jgi:hypothetical protein